MTKTRSGQSAAAAAICTLATMGLFHAPSANAETRTVSDPQQRHSQGPALDLRRATFTFDDDKAVFRLRFADLNKRRTQAFARFSVPNYDVSLSTRYDSSGQQRTTGVASDHYEQTQTRVRTGLRVRWDFKNNVITFVLTEHLRGARAYFSAYSVAKGDLHGPPRGDYIVEQLDRG